MPNYGLIVYQTHDNYSSSIFLNYWNKTNNPQFIAPSGGSGEAVRIYFDGIEVT
jgi:hypothetical protein